MLDVDTIDASAKKRPKAASKRLRTPLGPSNKVGQAISSEHSSEDPSRTNFSPPIREDMPRLGHRQGQSAATSTGPIPQTSKHL